MVPTETPFKHFMASPPIPRPQSRLIFFSSRRRHTRSLRDWSSDVCSSDLSLALPTRSPTCCWCWRATTATWSMRDRKSTRLNSSHVEISYAVFCLKKKKYVGVAEQFLHAAQVAGGFEHFADVILQ